MQLFHITYMHAGTGFYLSKLYARGMLLSNTTHHQINTRILIMLWCMKTHHI